MKRSLSWLAITGALGVVALAGAAWSVGWSRMWLTQDQRGRHLMAQQRYAEAAATFADPMWGGIAQFRAGNFKEAAQTFGGMDTAEAAYDQGNALIMLGKYDEAIARYDRALALRPAWPDAEADRTLAVLRAERVKQTGGEQGDQREKPDEVVSTRQKRTGGQETQTTGAPMSDEAVRALWLKRVQTRRRFPEVAVRLPAAGGVAMKVPLTVLVFCGALPAAAQSVRTTVKPESGVVLGQHVRVLVDVMFPGDMPRPPRVSLPEMLGAQILRYETQATTMNDRIDGREHVGQRFDSRSIRAAAARWKSRRRR